MKHSSIALSDHQFWVHQEVLRKFNMSSSYWSRIRSERQKFRRAFRGFSSQLMRQKLGLILHSHHLTWKLNCWNRMLKPRPVLFPPLQIPNPLRFLCWTLFVPEAMPVSHNVNSTIIPALLIHKNGPIYTFLSAFPVKNLRISRLLNSFMASLTS